MGDPSRTGPDGTAPPPGGERPPAGSIRLRFTEVVSRDGTRLEAWSNGGEGPTVLLCNGLGTNPYTWPALLRNDVGLHVVSWNHRGVGASERPEERHRVDIHTFVEDAVAVQEAAGVRSGVVAGWSLGVNTAFQLAVDHPERVTGLFALGGVPGDTFATMLGPVPLPLPHWARRTVMVNAARVVGAAGPLINPVTQRLPVGPRAAAALRHSGLLLPRADNEEAAAALREFLQTPMDWFMHMAVAASRHLRVPLASIEVPAMFVGGKYDLLAGSRQMRAAAESMQDAQYVELPASHFIGLEYPEEALALLRALVARAEQVASG